MDRADVLNKQVVEPKKRGLTHFHSCSCCQILCLSSFSFLSPTFGRAERDDLKKRPLPMSLPQARRKGLVINTERGSRVTRVPSCTCRLTNFLTIRGKRRLAESSCFIGWGLWGGGVSGGARRGVARTRRMIAHGRSGSSAANGAALRHNSCYPNRDGELLGCATIGVTENCGAMNMTNEGLRGQTPSAPAVRAERNPRQLKGLSPP